jgi:hypothetical protein
VNVKLSREALEVAMAWKDLPYSERAEFKRAIEARSWLVNGTPPLSLYRGPMSVSLEHAFEIEPESARGP